MNQTDLIAVVLDSHLTDSMIRSKSKSHLGQDFNDIKLAYLYNVPLNCSCILPLVTSVHCIFVLKLIYEGTDSENILSQ